jgi:hypothetical protein
MIFAQSSSQVGWHYAVKVRLDNGEGESAPDSRIDDVHQFDNDTLALHVVPVFELFLSSNEVRHSENAEVFNVIHLIPVAREFAPLFCGRQVCTYYRYG